jgi:fermentation-respiration switch protein FrsA (DUF1100 family)
MGAVKEQSANLYAQKIAEQGFVTLAVDLPYWGYGEGQPRNLVALDNYAESFSAGVNTELHRSGSARSAAAVVAVTS